MYSQLSKRCFRELQCQPSHGKISFANERYILVPASAFASQLSMFAKNIEQQENLVNEYTDSSVFQILNYIGAADCNYYTKFLGKDMERNNRQLYEIMALPPVISNTGWGKMTIHTEEMRLACDNFFVQFTVNSSAEAESSEGSKKGPCCGMIAGYVAGWMSTVVESQLVAAEVCCIGTGSLCCKFVVSNVEKVKGYANHFMKLHKEKNAQQFSARIDTYVNVVLSTQNL